MEKNVFLLIILGCAFQLTCSTVSKESLVRTLQNDDILTPSDFLIVAKKLLEKVEYPGVGKGIVSSSKTYQQLADKLFQRFFFTNARFAALRLYDVAGLDSIQALALSGDEFEPSRQFIPLSKKDFIKGLPLRCRYKLMTKKIQEKKHIKGHHKKATTDTKKLEKHKFKIEKTSQVNRGKITREIDETESVTKVKSLRLKPEKNNRHKREAISDNSTTAAPVTQNGRRNSPHTIPQAKRLLKNRMLVIKTDRKKREVSTEEPSKASNKRRREENSRKSHETGHHRVSAPALDTTTPDEGNDDVSDKSAENAYEFMIYNKMKHLPPKTIDKEKCYWRYQCPEQKFPFFTCELFPECENSKTDHFIRDDIPIAHTADEHDANFLRFRREVGVYLVDEEVEKIFEHRYLMLMRPKKGAKVSPGKNMEKKYGGANLQFYFQNLIRAEKATSTSTMAPPHAQDKDKRKREHNYKYLRAKIPYSDPKMQKQIKEAQEKRLRQTEDRQRDDKISSQQKGAVISMSMAVTSPLPDFMHQLKKK